MVSFASGCRAGHQFDGFTLFTQSALCAALKRLLYGHDPSAFIGERMVDRMIGDK